jgi:hypothetical protein
MIDSTTETLIALADVSSHLPERRGGRRPHISCIYRWTQVGCRGVVLETLQCGGTKVTSLEALQRFFERLSAQSNSNPTSVTSSIRKRVERAEKELAESGL